MIKKLFSLVALVLLAASCVNNVDSDNILRQRAVIDDDIVFYATIEGDYDSGGTASETKVFADSKMRVLWNADDRISIFNKDSYGLQYRFTGSEGANAGGFKKVPPEDEFTTGVDLPYVYAVYPYHRNTEVNYDGILTLTLPGEQTYKENSFGIGANTMVSVSSSTHLKFRNTGGYLSIKLYGKDVSVYSLTLKGNNHEKLAGPAKVTMPLNGTPSTVMQNTAVETITLTCDTPVALGPTEEEFTEFCFVVPPTTFTGGFTVLVTDALGGIFEMKTTKERVIERNSLTRMSPVQVVPDYDNAFVPFNDANFKAYCIKNFDKNQDGEISIKEAQYITEINICTDEVSSLNGIGFFVNLLRLRCYGSGPDSGPVGYYKGGYGKLTNLDLSKNTKLSYLDCQQNQITSLILPNSNSIKYLNCYKNFVKEIDLSPFTSLTNLNVWDNPITVLDLSYNTELVTLYCCDTQIVSLDVSHNPALTLLDCDYNVKLEHIEVSKNISLVSLSCSLCKLSSLDVSNNTALTHLSVSDNQITSLNVSSNTELIYLNCGNNQLGILDLSNNTALKSLSCGTNLLASLALSNNTRLTYLNCGNNQLAALDLSGNTALESLSCERNRLTSLSLSNNEGLTFLNCSYNQLTSLDLCDNTALTQVGCYNNYLSRLNVSNNTELTWLSCTSNQLTGIDVSHNTKLKELWCGTNLLTSLDVSYNPSLTVLNCAPNPYLTEIWVKAGQTIQRFEYDKSVAKVKYKDAANNKPVDLGLSVKWASCNVGASSPEGYGDYFAWGETSPKETYSWSTYRWCNGSDITLTRYNNNSNFGTVDNRTTLLLSDDAAYANWGGGWRIPTDAELTELKNQCEWTWTTRNGINGFLVKSKTNDNSIFLPAAGGRYDDIANYVGSRGHYWSSDLYSDYPCDAWYTFFVSGSLFKYSNDRRYYGLSVRPVTDLW